MESALSTPVAPAETGTSIEEAVGAARRLRAQGDRARAAYELDRRLSTLAGSEEPYLRNLLLNELEIARGDCRLESKPRGLGVTLTNECNIKCIMCTVWYRPWTLPDKSLAEIRELFPFLARIFWQGGEVFLHRHFDRLFEEIASFPRIRQDINTNGLLIDEAWAARLARANVSLIYSIDGVTRATYEKIRKEGRFDDLLASLARVRAAQDAVAQATGQAARLSITMNVVVMRSNYRELDGFVEFAHREGFKVLQINPVDITNREDIFKTPDAEALAHIAGALPRLREQADRLGLRLHTWMPSAEKPSFIREPDADAPPPAAPSAAPAALSCDWPWQFMHIDLLGRVRPHCFCGRDIGNVPESSIDGLWNNEQMQTYRRRLSDHTAAGWCASRCVEGQIDAASLRLDA